MPLYFFINVCVLIILLFLSFSESSGSFHAWGKNENGELVKATEGNLYSPTSIDFDALYRSKITHLAAGFTHSVVVDANGRVSCFGSNTKGECSQLKRGKNLESPTPVFSSSEAFYSINITKVFAGYNRTYVLDSENKLYQFGINDWGRFRSSYNSEPVSVPFQEPILEVSLHPFPGAKHTLLLATNGKVFSMGSNSQGQLGIQRQSESQVETMPVPVNTSGILKGKIVTQIAAGLDFSLLLTSEGRVFSFGNNKLNQLGVMPRDESGFEDLPVAVNTTGALHERNITQIAAGKAHSLFLSSEGLVFACGSNQKGSLGIFPVDENGHLPVAVNTSGVLAGKRITQIAASAQSSYLLSSDGLVFSFGGNTLGELGTFTEEEWSAIPVAVNTSGVLQGVHVDLIAAGAGHCLLLSSDGMVFSFGLNSNAQLSSPASPLLEPHPVPIMVDTNGDLVQISVASVNSGLSHIVVRDESGKVFTAGPYNQMMTEESEDHFNIDTLNPLPIEKPIFDCATGYGHTLFLDSSGTVWGTGWNTLGQLGSAEWGVDVLEETELVPVLVDNTGVLRGKIITQIAAGSLHSLLLDSTGSLFSFGNNNRGQIGICGHSTVLGEESDFFTHPVAVNSSVLHDKNIERIATGALHSLLLSSDGHVYALGDNTKGQCGVSSIVIPEQYTCTPVAVNTSGVLKGKKITHVTAGHMHSLFLSSEGKVYCVGDNSAGQCGVPHSPPFATVVAVDTSDALSGKTITQIAARALISILLSSDGLLYSFGINLKGELGIGASWVPATAVPQHVDMTSIPLENRTSLRISAGYNNNFAFSYSPSHTCFSKEPLHPLVCSGHGVCQAQDSCVCSTDYQGHDCSLTLCFRVLTNDSSVCSGNGDCIAPDQCSCYEQFSGSECSEFSCFGVSHARNVVCNGNGNCQAPNQCSCKEGFSGLNCERERQCFGQVQSSEFVCSGNGICQEENRCSCNPSWRWKGDSCQYDMQWLIIAASIVASLIILCVFLCGTTCVCSVMLKLFQKYKRAEKERFLTQKVLQGFIKDTEMDEMDEDNKRARLIVQQSMLEIDFNELTQLVKIGSGGSGAILFKAQWNGSPVAVKVFKSGLMSGDTFFDEFEHEVSLMSTLRHRNIINFLGCSLAYPRIAIIMELCSTGSVETVIENGKIREKSQSEILQMLLDIAEGMHYFHSRGVLHRDLKCANVLLDDYGVCKITDFGLSKYTKDKVAASHTVGIGTSYYCSPEQAEGIGSYGEGADIFAFGIMAMEILLCRMRPFPNSEKLSDLEIQRRMISDASFRPDVSQLHPNYSSMKKMLALCWHRDASRRPAFREIAKIIRACKKNSSMQGFTNKFSLVL